MKCFFVKGVAHEIAPLFEFYRNQELFERKDKRKKVDPDEEAKKATGSSVIEAEKKKLYEGKAFKLKISHVMLGKVHRLGRCWPVCV